MATVPNTTTFSLINVTTVVGGTNLVSAFTNAVDAQFDPAYKGAKNNLLNFRNYDTTRGGTYTLGINPTSHSGAGSFSVFVTASVGNSWSASAGSSTPWVTISNATGTGNGTFNVTVFDRPTGGSATSGSILITSAAPSVSMPITRA